MVPTSILGLKQENQAQRNQRVALKERSLDSLGFHWISFVSETQWNIYKPTNCSILKKYLMKCQTFERSR